MVSGDGIVRWRIETPEPHGSLELLQMLAAWRRWAATQRCDRKSRIQSVFQFRLVAAIRHEPLHDTHHAFQIPAATLPSAQHTLLAEPGFVMDGSGVGDCFCWPMENQCQRMRTGALVLVIGVGLRASRT